MFLWLQTFLLVQRAFADVMSRHGHLATLGATIMIAGLAVDPFIQQVIQIQPNPIVSKNNPAALPHVPRYDKGSETALVDSRCFCNPIRDRVTKSLCGADAVSLREL